VRSEAHSSRAAGTALSRIRNSRRLIAACISQPPLLDFVDDGKQVSAAGLYARLAEEVAVLEGLTIEYVGVVLCTFPTPERLRRVDFAALLHRIGVGVIVRTGPRCVTSVDDLKRADIHVGVVRGEVGWEYAKAFLKLDDDPRFKVLDPERMSELLELVRTGEVDAVLCDALSCRHWSGGRSVGDELTVNPVHRVETRSWDHGTDGRA
jgi:hypothetical protein